MGNRYKEDKPFAFYDPEQDREGPRLAPRNRSAPVSPRAPISPRAQPPGFYPEPDHGYNRPGLPTSPREQPFGHYDPELDRERQRQGMASYNAGPPSRPLDSEPGYRAPAGVDSRGIGRGIPSDNLPMSQGAPPNGSYGRGAPEPGYAGRGAPESGYAGGGAPEVGYPGGGAPELGYAGRGAPEPGYAGRGGAPEAGYAGRGGAPEPGYAGRGGAPEPGYAGRGGALEPGYDGRGGAPEPGYGGRGGAPEPGYGGRGGAPEPGYAGRGGASGAGYGGRGGASEPGYAGRGGAPAQPYPPPQQNPEFAGVSGRGRGGGYGEPPYDGNKPGYGDGEAGYSRPGRGAQLGGGRGFPVPPLGDGRYVYGGLQQPQRAEFEEEYGAPPAPISSEHAHQVYASVFSDPVYGGAGQFNSRAGYHEEPENLQQAHHKEDVIRHPDQF